MNFDFTDDQHEIKRTARDLLTKRSTWEKVREAGEGARYDDELWRELAELGWPGIAIAEDHGGQGMGVVELVILLEELGYACAATPFLGNALAGLVIQSAGSPDQQARWLPGLASGAQRGAVGAPGLIPDGHGADVLVLVTADGPRLVDASTAGAASVDAIDPTRRHASVTEAVARGGAPLPGDGELAVDLARAAVSAELVGLAQRALEMSVAYVKDRKQFETPVGAFQAVSHRCAQMLRDTEMARSATYNAAWAADAAPERLAEAAGVAKAAASQAGRDVTASAIQVHGGIGFTWEADVHWLYKRAQIDAALLGGAGAHRGRLAHMAAARLAAARA